MPRRREKSGTTDALEIMRRRYIGGKPGMSRLVAAARANADVAQHIYDLRIGAGLTQAQLAARVGTTASVISRLEDADYEGHSLSMLRRIAAAVGKRAVVRFVTDKDATATLKRQDEAGRFTSRAASTGQLAIHQKEGRVAAKKDATQRSKPKK